MVFLKDHSIFKRETSIIPFYYFPKPLKYMVLINVELFTRNKYSREDREGCRGKSKVGVKKLL